jgi:protein tyrosine phosphatase (PTP) superfamily phosphohydrolase (DUF442 family)
MHKSIARKRWRRGSALLAHWSLEEQGHVKGDFDEVVASIDNASRPLPGVVTAGQPKAEHFAQLATSGYRTIIDIRPPTEDRGFDEASVARKAGLEYVNVPVTADTLDDGKFDQIRVLLRDADHPVVLHCKSANRVGAVLIPYLVLDKTKTSREAVDIATRVGLRDNRMARAALAYIARHQSKSVPAS